MQSTANLEQVILETLRQLSPDKQQQVLDFTEFLRQKAEAPRQRRSFKGLYADLKLNLDEATITEAQREMWSGFPKEIPE
jgi:hypothetical protein